MSQYVDSLKEQLEALIQLGQQRSLKDCGVLGPRLYFTLDELEEYSRFRKKLGWSSIRGEPYRIIPPERAHELDGLPVPVSEV